MNNIQRYSQATGGDLEQYEAGDWTKVDNIAEVLNNATKYDKRCTSYVGCDIQVAEYGDYVRVDDIATALGLIEVFSEAQGKYIWEPKR